MVLVMQTTSFECSRIICGMGQYYSSPKITSPRPVKPWPHAAAAATAWVYLYALKAFRGLEGKHGFKNKC